jgi:16S rRNA G527 N7-methylase RsmG
LALEPHRRKWAFLRAVRRDLPVTNFTPIDQEDVAYRNSAEFQPFDVAVSKAAFEPLEWLERGQTLVGPGGTVLGLLGAQNIELPAGIERFDYGTDKPRAVLRLTVK